MKQSLLIIVVCAASASAQVIPTLYQPFGQIKDFLQLSDSQLQTILRNNSEYSSWASGKQSRIFQVQSEIAQETTKENLDSMALGVRYTEVELICRDIKQQIPVYQKKNTDVLTDTQKARLKVLEDAVKLAPVISEAQSVNLLGGGGSSFASILTGTPGLIGIAGFSSQVNGCSSSLPFAVIRTGDFSSTLTNGSGAPAASSGTVRP